MTQDPTPRPKLRRTTATNATVRPRSTTGTTQASARPAVAPTAKPVAKPALKQPPESKALAAAPAAKVSVSAKPLPAPHATPTPLPAVAPAAPVAGAPAKRGERGLKFAVAALSLISMTLAGLLVGVVASNGSATVEASAPEASTPALKHTAPATPSASKPVAQTVAAGTPASSIRGNLLLARFGAKVEGAHRNEVLNDGDVTNYDHGNGYGSHPLGEGHNGAIVVTLAEAQELNRVKFLLWDKDDRRYAYKASISPDGSKWIELKDTTKEPARSWQDLRFTLQPVKAVKIQGVSNSIQGGGFDLIEIEGYNDIPMLEPAATAAVPSEAELVPGLRACYFDGISGYASVSDTPTLIGSVAKLAFQAQTIQAEGTPAGWPLARFAATFEGYIKIEQKATYTFFLESDDGSRMYIDGKLQVENDGFHGMEESWEQVELEPGLHRIFVAYFDAGGGRGLNLRWQFNGEMKEAVPAEKLFHHPSDLDSRTVAAK